MENNNNIWVSVEELNNDPDFIKSQQQEFFELPIVEGLSKTEELKTAKSSRRDFLKYLGFGIGAATIAAGCEIPIRKAIPYVVKPDEIVPGVATYYATSFVNGGDYCSVLVKTREGRPIKVEGNILSSVTKGGTSARAQAAVLSLYDTNRVKAPATVADGKATDTTWEELDKAITNSLRDNATVRIVANTLMSPSLKGAIEEFKVTHPNTELVQYDPISADGILSANEASFGKRVIPAYHFDKAMVIASFGADFLGTWISPIEYAADYIKNRKIKDAANPVMSKHYHLESAMTMTGSNADERILVKPSENGAALVELHNKVAAATGDSSVNSSATLNAKAKQAIAKMAAKLVANKGKALVVCGSNDANEQTLVNKINSMLDSYGNTISFGAYSMQRQGNDKAINELTAGMSGVDAVFILGANPVYDLPNGEAFATALKSVKTTVSFNGTLDETAACCKFVAPDNHFLESWGDVEPKKGMYSLIQPTIAPLFKTRAAGESLLTWANSAELDKEMEQPYFEYVRNFWLSNMFDQQNKFARFAAFWDNCLHDGVFEVNDGLGEEAEIAYAFAGDAAAAASSIKGGGAGLEISFTESVSIGNGSYANNPWLQEMPDPVTRVVWDNVLAIPVAYSGKDDNKFVTLNNLDDGDMVDVTVNGKTYSCSVVRQFGQMQGTVAIALGYGRTMGGPTGKNVGTNFYPALSTSGTKNYFATAEVSNKKGKDGSFACVQLHHTYGMNVRGEDGKIAIDQDSGRPFNADERVLGHKGFQGSLTDRSVVYYSNTKDLKKNVENLKVKRANAEHLNQQTLYPYDEYNEKFYSQGHHWGMSIDLNACIGCGACSVACMAENNVPVVGKHEVHRVHEMSWIRIDRYFYGDMDSPNVVYQPMMCQHCDNAPCENVCPVAATNHSSEGLNQMTYNRCIGTRYCANNCPYKVRRFNWLDYTSADLFAWNESDLNKQSGEEEHLYMADNLTRMVLNPDVTVRTRGVIEKCSFCVQRIQEGKLTAKKEARALRDGDVKTACQTACPTDAIIFGDTNLKSSKVNENWNSDLNYFVLEEVNTRASVGYKMRVVNREDGVGFNTIGDQQLLHPEHGDGHGHGNDSHGADHGKGQDSHEGHDHGEGDSHGH